MHVLRRKKFPATFLEPTFASTRLTLRAVPISTRIVRDGAMSATSALIEMSAERGGATPRNRQEHFDMLPADPLTASFDECVTRGADQIGHLEGWPVHLLVLGRPSGVTSKPASWGHFKSGQWKVPGTLDVVPVHALFNQA